MKRGLFLLLLLVFSACAAPESGDDDDSDSSDGGVDGGPLDCRDLEMIVPGRNLLPGENIDVELTWQGAAGIQGITWTIEDPEENIFTGAIVTDEGQRVRIGEPTPGSWQLRAEVALCGVVEELIYVQAPMAEQATYRLRFYPQPATKMPFFEDSSDVVVFGNAPYELDPIEVPAGNPLDGVVVLDDERGSHPLEAQLELVSQQGGLPVMLHAGQNGRYAGNVTDGNYRVLVVPYLETRAPAERVLSAQDLATGIHVDPGQPVSGRVVDASGQGVNLARVALSSPGLPASIVRTDPDGEFTGWARAPGAIEVRVTPEGDTQLGLFADASLGLSADGGELELRLPSAEETEVELIVQSSNLVPLAGATVRVISVGEGGSVTQAALSQTTRRSGKRTSPPTDAAGKALLGLPAGAYTLVVDPPAGSSETASSVQVTVTGPAKQTVVLHSKPTSPTQLKVVTSDGAALPAGTKVIAVSRGLQGVGAGTSVVGSIPEVGPVGLSLVDGAIYDVLVLPPATGSYLRESLVLTAGEANPPDVVLKKGLELRGALVDRFGELVPGTRVTLVCPACTDPNLELAETSTADDGTFRFLVPDPGISGTSKP